MRFERQRIVVIGGSSGMGFVTGNTLYVDGGATLR